jgi:Zn-finger nucleic acid-binding protein
VTSVFAGLGKQEVLTRIESSLRWLDAGPKDKFLASPGKREVLTRIESSFGWLDAGTTDKLLGRLGQTRGADSNRVITFVELMPVRRASFLAGLEKQELLPRIESSLRWLDAGPTEKMLAGMGKQAVLSRVESSLSLLDAGLNEMFLPVWASKRC